MKENNNGLKIEQMLMSEDWLILTQLAESLKVFYTATIALEGHVKNVKFDAMWKCVSVLEVLSNNLICLQIKYPLSMTFKMTDLTSQMFSIMFFSEWILQLSSCARVSIMLERSFRNTISSQINQYDTSQT